MPIDPVEPRDDVAADVTAIAGRRSPRSGVPCTPIRPRLGLVPVTTDPRLTAGPMTPGTLDHRRPDLPQERRLVTAIPGPRSQEKFARRGQHVAQGVGTTLPVFVEAAGGGVLVDVDGNSLIDLASGIAVASVGNAAPHVVDRVIEQVRAFTHTCFMVTPYDGYVDVCELLAELTPGDHEKKSALLNSGAEAVENAVKVARAYTGRDAVAVFDHAYHGRTNLTMAMTVEVDALQARLRPVRRRGLPGADVLPVPRDRRRSPARQAADRAIDVLEKQVGADNLACAGDRADPRRGRLRRPGHGLPAAPARVDRGQRHRASSPTRSRPASAAPATGSPATTRASSPTWSPPPRASPAASRWPRSPAAPRSWTPCTSAASAARTAATRSPAPPRSAPSRRCRSRTSPAGPARSAPLLTDRLTAIADEHPVRRATSAAAAR